jgi:uroporphyrin-3 C-methyltransferase
MIPTTPPPDTSPTATPTAGSFPRSTSRARTFWLVWVLLFLLFLLSSAGVAGAFYVWMQTGNAGLLQQQQSDTLDKQVTQIQKQLKESQEAQDRFRQQTVHVLTENSEKLRGLDRIDTSYWRLAEAEFLLKQAHQRLFITHDAETADLLLASADSAIMQQKDPGLLPVRTAIASDRAALRKVPRVDHDGIYLRLQALSSQVGMLASANRFLQEESTDNTDEALSYREKLLNRLVNIVRIRHHDQAVEPLLPPEQEVYLRQNIQLALVQAQLGLLQNQQQTYQSNLERIDAWVRQYCQTEDQVVQTWLAEVQSLKRQDIAPELPDISGSLRTVEKVIEKRAEEIQRSLMLEGDEHNSDTAPTDVTTETPAPTDTPAAAEPAAPTNTGEAIP